MLKYIPLIVLDIIIWRYLGTIPGVVCLWLILIGLSYTIGFLRSIKIYKATFVEGIAYTKDYTVPFKELGPTFSTAVELITKFKLEKDYNCIGLYFDCSEKSTGNPRSSVGIYHKKTSSTFKINEDWDKYALDNGWKKTILPSATSLYSSWDYSNIISMMIGIGKFYTEWTRCWKSAEFREDYNIKNENLKTCSIEVYTNNNSRINFYMPLVKTECFMIHGDLKEEEKR